jgi:hypothetical protein
VLLRLAESALQVTEEIFEGTGFGLRAPCADHDDRHHQNEPF